MYIYADVYSVCGCIDMYLCKITLVHSILFIALKLIFSYLLVYLSRYFPSSLIFSLPKVKSPEL